MFADWTSCQRAREDWFPRDVIIEARPTAVADDLPGWVRFPVAFRFLNALGRDVFLNALGRDVEIVIRPAHPARAADTRVITA